jgi:hypothetical protein
MFITNIHNFVALGAKSSVLQRWDLFAPTYITHYLTTPDIRLKQNNGSKRTRLYRVPYTYR